MKEERRIYKWTLQQRLSILLFLFCNALLLLFFYLLPTKVSNLLDLDSYEVQEMLLAMEEAYKKDSLQKTFTKKPFNPNFITAYQAKIFSIDTAAFARIQAYRATGQWIQSIAEFQRLTQMEAVQLKQIQTYLKFPDWVEQNQIKSGRLKASQNTYAFVKKDLNLATKEELLKVSGIGEALSTRIIDWREKLSGYADTLQLLHVYGLTDWARANLWKHFYIEATEPSLKINLKLASVSDLLTIPGLDFDMARRLWEFYKLEEGMLEFEDLIKIEGMTLPKLKLIELYLYIE